MLNRINRKLEQKGFTLIELMIVVAIIGILAAIAIPNFRNYQLKAKRGELPTNLKAIKTAEVAYQAEEDTFVKLVASPSRTFSATVGGKKAPWVAGAGFESIGWQPSGEVFGVYSSPTAATAAQLAISINGIAQSNIDQHATEFASYDFNVNIQNPALDNDVNRTTAADWF